MLFVVEELTAKKLVVVLLAKTLFTPVRLLMKAFVIEAPAADRSVVEALIAVRLEIKPLVKVRPVPESSVVDA